MKFHYVIPALIIIALSFSACSKKEGIKKFPTIDSTRVPDSIVRVNAKAFPYTDTFIGPLYVYYGSGEMINSTNPAYAFYVLHLGLDSMVFESSAPFDIQRSVSFSIRDTGRGGMNVDLDAGNYSCPHAIRIVLEDGVLSFSWDIPDMPAFGVCDEGESKCQYNGVLTNKN